MAFKNIPLTIDTMIRNPVPIEGINQEDNIELNIVVTENKTPKDLSSQTIKVYVRRIDGTLVEQTDQITPTNASKGEVTVKLKNSAFNKEGYALFQLDVSDSIGRITSSYATFKIGKGLVSAEAIANTNEVEALKKIEEYIKKANLEFPKYEEKINEFNKKTEEYKNEVVGYQGQVKEFQNATNSLQAQFDEAVANITNGVESATNSEIVQARGGEVNLNRRLDKFDSQLDTNTNKINRSYYLDEYKKNNDISYLEAFNRIISEIPEGYGCDILLKNKEYTLHDTLDIVNKSINIIGIGGKIRDKTPRNATGTNIKYTGEKNNIPVIRFTNCYGSKVSGISFIGNEDYSFYNRGIVGIVATATMEGDLFTGHCRYLELKNCSFFRLYSGVKLGENDLCVVEFTTIDKCEFFQNRIGVHLLTRNVYSTNIDNCTFLGYEKEKYHIYCENGHFSSSTCFFGPCGNTDELGGGYAIYLENGYCNLYDPYAEIHGGTFLVWENAHPSYARTNIYGADIRRRVEDAPSETNIKNMTNSMLNVYGGCYDGKFELSNSQGQINVNGVRQPLFINSNLDKICCNNSFINNRNISALYKNTIYGDANGNPELEFYNGEDQSFIKLKRDNKKLSRDSSFGVGIIEDFENKLLNLGSTSWGIRLCSQNGGSFTLLEGQTEMTIQNTTITNASKIFIYPTSSESVTLDTTKRLYVKAKNVGSGFIIRLNDSSQFPSNCKYDYLVFDGNW